MDSVALIRRLHQHRVWSNQKLRAAVTGLTEKQLHRSFDIGRGSLWATLVHLYAAEHVWLEALRGRNDVPFPRDDVFASFEELQISWIALDRRWERYLDDLTPSRLPLPVYKRSTSYGAGRIYKTPASDVLLHVCTHAHYTTAQAINMLRGLGVPSEALPDPQLITLSRQETES